LEHHRNDELAKLHSDMVKKLKLPEKKYRSEIIARAVKKKADLGVKKKSILNDLHQKYITASDPKVKQNLKKHEVKIISRFERVENKLEKFIIKNKVKLNKYLIAGTVISMAAILQWYYRNTRKINHENTV
jgi:hypothetical protein